MKNFDIKEIEGDQSFDPSTLYPGSSFTQTDFYGKWQKSLNRKVRRFLVYQEREIVAYFQVIKYTILGDKSYLYTPYGPIVKEYSDDLLFNLKKFLTKISKEENAIFTRLDFAPLVSSDILSKFFTKSAHCTYHSAHFQPRTEWLMNLIGSEEDLLMSLRKKTRYAIRLAQREGIEIEIVKENFQKYFETFYELMKKTAGRNNFNLHPKKYYQSVFQNLSPGSFLVIARYQGEILVVNVIIISGKVANYVFGSSKDEERKKMPTYLAQWSGILESKKSGCKYYNFGGVSSESDEYEYWDNLTLFKKKFIGKEQKHSEFFDIVISPFWYGLYNLRKWIKKAISQ